MSEMVHIWITMFLAGFGLLFAIAIYAFTCIGRMKMFEKAGYDGWKAWIPVYRDYCLCEITMGKGWYCFFGLIPFLVPVMKVLYSIEVSLSYGAGPVFAILYFFLPFIAELVLGFGDSTYLGAQDPEGQVRSILNSGRKKAEEYRQRKEEEKDLRQEKPDE